MTYYYHHQTEAEQTEAKELEEFIKYQLEQQKQDQHDLKLFYEMRKEEEEETDELSIDNHILRIKRVLNEFVNEVENNSFPFLRHS